VAPNILLSIFLLVTSNYSCIDSFSTFVCLAYIIIGLIIVQFDLKLAFFDIGLLLNIF